MEALPPAAFDPVAEANPREYWRILIRRKWILLLALLLSTGGSVVYTWRAPRQYAASSKVHVKKPDGFVSLSEWSLYSGQINPNTQIALIKTRPVIARAVSRLGETHNVHLSVDAVMAGLKVDSVPNTELIEIGVEWRDPEVARMLANAMATAFVDHRTEVARKSQAATLDFLNTNLRRVQQELTGSLDALQRFEERTHFSVGDQRVSPQGLQRLDRLAEAEADLAKARFTLQMTAIERQRLREQLDVQNRQLAALDPGAVRDNSLLQKTRAALEEKQRELTRARARLTPEGLATFEPGLEQEVATLQRQLNQQMRVVAQGGVDLELQQHLIARLAELDAEEQKAAVRVQGLERSVAALDAERQRLPALARRYSRLLLDKEANEKIYTLLYQKRQETEISRVSQLGNAEVVESAVTQPSPVWPKPRQNLAFAFAFGLMLGVAAAFLIEFLDDSLATPEDVERYLHLPTLGSIPLIREPNNRLLTLVSPRSGLAEAYRMIRSSVAFTSVDAPLRAIMVTSAGPGEGKSMMAANLAIVHAQKGMRVILVDCDLRRPCQQKLFSLPAPCGFTNLVVGSATIEDALQNVGIENLHVVASGPLPPNPAEMLDSARARQVIDDLREHADLVVFDTPPCAALSDSVVLATQVDGVLLVVESGETNRNAASQAVYHLAVGKANMLGAILNKVDLRREGYHSYYYYHQYYRSYYADDKETGALGRLEVSEGMLAARGAGDQEKKHDKQG